jgi:hypothetical protein
MEQEGGSYFNLNNKNLKTNYMKYKDDSPYTSKDYYFRFDGLNDMINYLDKIVQWKIEFPSGRGTRKNIQEFINKMKLENDPYFLDLLKGKEKHNNISYPYPKD